MILDLPAPCPPGLRAAPQARPVTPANPAEGSFRTRVHRRHGEKLWESRAPQNGPTSTTTHPYSGPQALQRPTCAGTGRRKSGTVPRSPALPPPDGPVEVLQEAARETAALAPRTAVAAHNTALFPPTRRPTASRPPDARSHIPHVRSGDPRPCGGRPEPLRTTGLNCARPAP